MLSAYGVKIKWSHIRAVRSERGVAAPFNTEDEREVLIELSAQYYGTGDYATPDRFTRLTDEEVKTMVPAIFEVNSRKEFGIVQPSQINLDKTQWVRTNIQAFPWNRFELDGQDVPQSDIRTYDGLGIALRVPAGTHRLAYKFAPDRLWRILRTISLLTLFSWVVGAVVSPFVSRPR
jgi:hypothetical protein